MFGSKVKKMLDVVKHYLLKGKKQGYTLLIMDTLVTQIWLRMFKKDARVVLKAE